jgi:hypothetical protein
VHGGLVQQLLLAPWQRVQPRCDHSLHRLRQLTGRPAFLEHADVLLCEERIAARAVEEDSLFVRELQWLLQKRGDQPRRVVFREWLQ